MFTYEWYAHFLHHCRDCGNVTLLRDAATGPLPQIILRHDVDFDLAAAWDLSLVEEKAGVRSTYYFLVSTHYYNCASAKARVLLTGMVQRGFEVGLHFDASVYADGGLDRLSAGFRAERDFLESIICDKIRSASTHCPGAQGFFRFPPDVIDAYDPRWFGPERYVSDSNFRWRSDPIALVTKAAELQRVQVLSHPLHFSELKTDYRSILGRMADAWRTEAHKYMYNNNTTYHEACAAQSALPASGEVTP